MSERFRAIGGDRIVVEFSEPELVFLSDVIPLLDSVGRTQDDPGHERLNVPAFLGDPDSSEEWSRAVGDRLDLARSQDRMVFAGVVGSEQRAVLDLDQAGAVLRVLNEARLVLAARLGVEVESDYSRLSEDELMGLHFLGFLVEDLVEEMSRALP